MKLHYSQTYIVGLTDEIKFYYLMKLHYSQTSYAAEASTAQFYYLMKLHYSQTPVVPSPSLRVRTVFSDSMGAAGFFRSSVIFLKKILFFSKKY